MDHYPLLLSVRKIATTDLRLERAVQLVGALSSGQLEYARLVECLKRETDGAEILVFDVEVERPQDLIYPIHRTERLAVAFDPKDSSYPEVQALRSDFPLVPHLNLRHEPLPRSLCLYDRPWSEIRLTWSPYNFVETTRQWLALTARGELHQEDQPLEPFLQVAERLIIPSDLELPADGSHLALRIHLAGPRSGDRLVLRACLEDPANSGQVHAVAVALTLPPTEHGVIHRLPRTLADLIGLCTAIGYDLLQALRTWAGALADTDRQDGKRAVVILNLPKTRAHGGAIEFVESKAFVTSATIADVGVAIGLWERRPDGNLGTILLPGADADGAAEIPIAVFDVIRELRREQATVLAGEGRHYGGRVLAIGAGSLGSQVGLNLARVGWGIWTVVDDDVVLPHNLCRHAGFLPLLGWNKAAALEGLMNGVFDAEDRHGHLPWKLRSNDDSDQGNAIDRALDESDLVLDLSASVAVSRQLSERVGGGRRISLFLSPSGRDLVLLAEDEARTCRLTDLEMVYLRNLAIEPRLAGLLDVPGGAFRYGATCRDVSMLLPQSHVALHAGIAAAAIPLVAAQKEASARVWRLNPGTLEVSHHLLHVRELHHSAHALWNVAIDPDLLQQIQGWRASRLPRETGGILLGSVDHDSRRLFILVALPSPDDSIEQPTLYIRGSHRLAEQRSMVIAATAGFVDYIGEWHSHPEGASLEPSEPDRKVHEWIEEHTSLEGRPPVMLIAGREAVRVLVGPIEFSIPVGADDR